MLRLYCPAARLELPSGAAMHESLLSQTSPLPFQNLLDGSFLHQARSDESKRGLHLVVLMNLELSFGKRVHLCTDNLLCFPLEPEESILALKRVTFFFRGLRFGIFVTFLFQQYYRPPLQNIFDFLWVVVFAVLNEHFDCTYFKTAVF